MDLQLPGMDGLELTRRLKADPARRSIAIIALTAYAMKGDEQRALAAGCDGYVTKPIDIVTLPQTVREQLTRQNRRFLLDLFGSITKPELCIASDVGSEILRQARKRAQAEGWTRSDHWRAATA